METKYKYVDRTSEIQKLRDTTIETIDRYEFSTKLVEINASELYKLGLNMYSKNDSLKSAIFNALSKSKIDQNISLHQEQLDILKFMATEKAMIISAPTSFGKTFCIFEYIVRNKPNICVLIVPTLALSEEYLGKILRKYRKQFAEYDVYTTIDSERKEKYVKPSIFILTHDRALNANFEELVDEIDFLVVDEVYKLQDSNNCDDRTIVLNMAYYKLAKIALKYVLLAPFIDDVQNREQLPGQPLFYKTNYSPVYNKVVTKSIINDSDKERFMMANQIVEEIGDNHKTLIYFPKVSDLNKYVKDIISNKKEISIPSGYIKSFIEWAENEIHPEWSIIVALKRGYVIHNGQITRGTKSFCLDLFEKNSSFNYMLCTSSLLEGVNTVTENIIITKPHINYIPFTGFDFYNLVGRSGRLLQHMVGTAYYIKSEEDEDYDKLTAAREIKFELTSNSEDIQVAKGMLTSEQYINFLKELNITNDIYADKIGVRCRFTSTVKDLYDNFKIYKQNLYDELEKIYKDDTVGRIKLIKALYTIISPSDKYGINYLPGIISKILNKKRLSIRTIIGNPDSGVNNIIREVIKMKYSFIEHEFYNKVLIIMFFFELEYGNLNLIDIIKEKIIIPIDTMYFNNNYKKRMIYDYGIYDRDVEKVYKIIGDQFENSRELSDLLSTKIDELNKSNISFMSRYIINLKK